MSHEQFMALAAPYLANLVNVANKIVRNRSDAEDVAQIALQNAWAARQNFDTSRDFGAWLRTIARNEARSFKRSREVHLACDVEDRRECLAPIVYAAICKLSAADREVLDATMYDSERNAAERFGTTRYSVRERVNDGRVRLAKILREMA
jgi:RNA polymerase sigma factor (sigma-70 family)